jgi:hypothetical protein
MKTLAGLAFLFSISAYASDVQLSPGGSVRVNANTDTTVTCSGDQGSRYFCVCDQMVTGLYRLSRYDIVGTDRIVSTLHAGIAHDYDCSSELRTHPACK